MFADGRTNMFFVSFKKWGTTGIPVSFSGGCSSLNGVHSSSNEFAPRGANSFLEDDPFEKAGKKKKGKITDFFI